ncbi:hypothetical protein [Parasitella parasitica]|uniref:Uncharacterized protein n=1 Tax=Parasitella parasitica TaxID=35722 RepID=A0A0B7NJ97_9FUNG|nr:hypothetical protein [Parasitella parasitica]
MVQQQEELTEKKIHIIVQYRRGAREYMRDHAKELYWKHMEYTDDSENETPDGFDCNCCFLEVKKNNSYILRIESVDGIFIQHNRGLVKMDVLLVDQGVYVKPTRATSNKRKIQDGAEAQFKNFIARIFFMCINKNKIAHHQ